jgi:hypothetical protein
MNTSTTLLPVLVTCAACGGGDDPGLPGAEPLECEGQRDTRTFRIDEVHIPGNPTEAELAGADLDGDGTIDNQAGNLLSALTMIYPDLATTLEPQLAARLTGDVEWLVGIEQCDGEVRVSVGDPGRAGDVPAAGTWDSPEDPGLDLGELYAEQGEGAAPIGALADLGGTGFDAWHRTFPTRIELEIGGDRAWGRLIGAIAPGYETILAEAVQPYLQGRLDAGESDWAAEADTDGDGVLTTDEILVSFEFSALTGGDLEDDSFSFGFVVEAAAID